MRFSLLVSRSAEALGPLCRLRPLWLLPPRRGVLHAGSLSRAVSSLHTHSDEPSAVKHHTDPRQGSSYAPSSQSHQPSLSMNGCYLRSADTVSVCAACALCAGEMHQASVNRVMDSREMQQWQKVVLACAWYRVWERVMHPASTGVSLSNLGWSCIGSPAWRHQQLPWVPSPLQCRQK